MPSRTAAPLDIDSQNRYSGRLKTYYRIQYDTRFFSDHSWYLEHLPKALRLRDVSEIGGLYPRVRDTTTLPEVKKNKRTLSANSLVSTFSLEVGTPCMLFLRALSIRYEIWSRCVRSAMPFHEIHAVTHCEYDSTSSS